MTHAQETCEFLEQDSRGSVYCNPY